MENLLNDIEKSTLKNDEKVYINTLYRENLDNLIRNIKF